MIFGVPQVSGNAASIWFTAEDTLTMAESMLVSSANSNMTML